ncbi:MAG: type II/IV secretion system protein [Gemmatimonadaceae bacterium]|nr:type II/IV secretion system protein [Gemmatimonadaceae bacterium]
MTEDAPPPARDLRDAAAGVLARRLSPRYLEEHTLLPLGVDDDGALVVAVGAPPDATVLDELGRLYERPIRFVEHAIGEIQAALLTAERESPADAALAINVDGDEDEPLDDLRALAEQEPVIRLVNVTLLDALRAGASDVHFEPLAADLRVRYRLDGVLREMTRVGRQYQAAVVSRIKIMAGLDIAERRRPQDGRIRLKLAGREVDLRVSTLPGLHGEGIVLRLLDPGVSTPELASLGMPDGVRSQFEKLIGRTGGLMLVTGPTGSGKTTTLYAALARLNTQAVKIVTVEDPIEYRIDGVTQVPVNVRAGMNFASALRSILRHDPDIIMVGELRDAETATIAIQAALTGHLVLSTLHTTDAVGAVTRLVDMGVDPFLVAATLQGALAQRLVRLLCDTCAARRDPTVLEMKRWGGVPMRPRVARGCESCAGTGYRGRRGIYELFVPDEALRAAIVAGTSPDVMRTHAITNGTVLLREEGFRLVREGLTTPEELVRAVGESDT